MNDEGMTRRHPLTRLLAVATGLRGDAVAVKSPLGVSDALAVRTVAILRQELPSVVPSTQWITPTLTPTLAFAHARSVVSTGNPRQNMQGPPAVLTPTASTSPASP